MSEAFTPGPWRVTTCMDYWVEHNQPVAADDNDFNGVALVGDITWPNADSRQDQWEANARLISAAPEMFDALAKFASVRIERAVPETEKTDPWPDSRVLVGFDGWELTVGMVRAARAALAKARGET